MRIVGVLAQAWAGEFSQTLHIESQNRSQVTGKQVAEMFSQRNLFQGV